MTVVIAASYKHILILVYALEYKLFVNIKKKNANYFNKTVITI